MLPIQPGPRYERPDGEWDARRHPEGHREFGEHTCSSGFLHSPHPTAMAVITDHNTSKPHFVILRTSFKIPSCSVGFSGSLTASSFRGITLDMPENQKAVAYVRAPETRGQDRVYQEKFSGFIQSIAEAKANGIENLVISSPWVIGDTYEEIIESLSRLADSGIALHVVEG